MNEDNDTKRKISNARLALLIAAIPVMLFIASFFIKLY